MSFRYNRHYIPTSIPDYSPILVWKNNLVIATQQKSICLSLKKSRTRRNHTTDIGLFANPLNLGQATSAKIFNNPMLCFAVKEESTDIPIINQSELKKKDPNQINIRTRFRVKSLTQLSSQKTQRRCEINKILKDINPRRRFISYMRSKQMIMGN